MENLSPLDELDYFLELLKKRNDIVTIGMIIDFSGESYSVDEYFKIRRIIDKFLRDKMVFEIPDTSGFSQPDPYYQLTYEGLLFHGYNKQKEIDDIKHSISAHNERRIVRNEKWLTLGTWFAGIAALLLLLWQVFLWMNPVYAQFPYILFRIVRK